MYSFDITTYNLNYTATNPGIHVATVRWSYQPASGYRGVVRYVYLRLNNVGIAAGIANAGLAIQLNGFNIAELVAPATGTTDSIRLPLELIVTPTDVFRALTTQAGAGNAGYVLTTHIWEF